MLLINTKSKQSNLVIMNPCQIHSRSIPVVTEYQFSILVPS